MEPSTSISRGDAAVQPTELAPPGAASSSRGLTVAQGTALTVGAVLGTGVITLPAVAAEIAGPASLIAWALLVLLSVPLAGTFATLGGRYPDTGGVSSYAGRAFGPRWATVVGWIFLFSVPVGAPAAAMMAAGYVADAFGGGRTTTVAVAFAMIIVVVIMNAFGLRLSGRVQLGLTAALALIMTVTIVAALPHARLSNLTPFAPHGWLAIGPAAAVLVWGFAGWEAVSSLAADYRRPGRDVPRATGAAIGIVGVLYLALAGTALLVLGPATGSSTAPLSDVLAVGTGGQVRAVTAVVAVLLSIGAMNAYFAGSSRLAAALGRDGGLPSWFARGSEAGQVPTRGVLLVGVLSLLAQAIAAIGGWQVDDVMLLTTGGFTLVYVAGTAAAVRLLPARSFDRRLALLALVSVVILAVMTGPHLVWAGFVAIAAYGYTRLTGRSGDGGAPRGLPASAVPDATGPDHDQLSARRGGSPLGPQ
ncbi:APC family permease [Microlunatus soli]|uniref:Amino acid exporter, AAE family n=1 Tax=Microlunatus soli TaxID=630515 RepID=A0A1H1U742_9ACTN|nr:amino acid permease [Microlunatus soli]SDS68086.1 amino acid exporter, AAE family [Microlunatus soli]